MSGTLRFVGGMTVFAALVFASLMPGGFWLRAAYAVAGIVASLTWFALAEVLERLEVLQATIDRPSD